MPTNHSPMTPEALLEAGKILARNLRLVYGAAGQAETVDALVDALSAAQPAPGGQETGWQPIDTAPKDGTRVLLCDACFAYPKAYPQCVAQGFWLETGHWGYWADRISDFQLVWFAPTHWMPLPEPPNAY